MASSNATRVATLGSAQASITSGIFGVSGGSRGYYLEPLGTDDPFTYGLQSSGTVATGLAADTALSGIIFNIADD